LFICIELKNKQNQIEYPKRKSVYQKIKQMKKLLLLPALTLSLLVANAQCVYKTTAVASGDVLNCNGGDGYKTAVAYNPDDSIYYSINAGATTANEYFDASGTYLGDNIDTDYRGLWYNSSISAIEGNTWQDYFLIDSLLSDGSYAGSNASPFATSFMPETQSVGAFDYDDNVIYFYSNGLIYSRSRVDGTQIDSIAITGISNFATISSKTIIYTGCANGELGIFDVSTKTLHIINKVTGAVTTSIAFPTGSPTLTSFWQFSFANELFWMYDATANNWIGYRIYDVLVSSISVQSQGGASTISTNSGTLQLTTTVLPTNATIANVTWSVTNGTGTATIDNNGLLTAATNGTVTVVATANDGSGISGNMVITISNQTTGIHEINNFQARIYPNPTTGLVTINTTEVLEKIEIYEITGKQIAHYSAVNTLDLSSLPKGIYIIKLYSGNSVAIQQVVKK
jgi:hypothetical protein